MKEYIFHSRLSVWEIERRLRQAQRDPLEAGLTEVNVTSECGFCLWFFVSLLPILVLYVVFYLSDNLILNKDQKKRIIAFIEERLLHP